MFKELLKWVVQSQKVIFLDFILFWKICLVGILLSAERVKTWIQSLGLSNEFLEEKESLDEYKANMSKALFEKPSTFLFYSMNNIFALQACVKFQVIFTRSTDNKIFQEVYNVMDESLLFTMKNIPFSLGALVKRFFVVFVEYVLFGSNKEYFVILNKHSIINEFSKKILKFKKLFKKWVLFLLWKNLGSILMKILLSLRKYINFLNYMILLSRHHFNIHQFNIQWMYHWETICT